MSGKEFWKPLGNFFTNLFGLEIKKFKGLVLNSWKTLALPKSIGGWGLKNPFLFSKARLVAKNVWRLIQGTSLWV
jgi:hypothetical protein